MKRRYIPVGSEPIYDKELDRLRLKSNILKQRNTMEICLSDKQGIENEILKLKGNTNTADSKYYNPNSRDWEITLLKLANEDLLKIKSQFQDYRQMRVNKGFAEIEDSIENYPSALKEKLLQLEARYDVFTEELELLEKLLATYVNTEKEISNANILKYGTIGTIRIKAGICVEIDFQNVSVLSNGQLVIDEISSPYHGIMVQDYRTQIIPLWNRIEMKRKYGVIMPKSALPLVPDGLKTYSDELARNKKSSEMIKEIINKDSESEYTRKKKSINIS